MSSELTRDEFEMLVMLAAGPHSTQIREGAGSVILTSYAALRTRMEEQTEKADAYKNCMYEEMAENVKLFELLGVHQAIKDGTAGTEAVTHAIRELLSRLAELEEWKRIVIGTGTDQEAVIRLAASEYTKTAVQCWKDRVADLEQRLAEQTEKADKFEKLFKLSCTDNMDYLTCQPECDSYGHSEKCAVAYPGLEFTRLRDQLAEQTRRAEEAVCMLTATRAHLEEVESGQARQHEIDELVEKVASLGNIDDQYHAMQQQVADLTAKLAAHQKSDELLHWIVEHDDGDFDRPQEIEEEAQLYGIENVLKMKRNLAALTQERDQLSDDVKQRRDELQRVVLESCHTHEVVIPDIERHLAAAQAEEGRLREALMNAIDDLEKTNWPNLSTLKQALTPKVTAGHEHEWGTDGAHSNEFCKLCFMSRK